MSSYLLRPWHTSSYGTHGLLPYDACLAWRHLYLRAFSSFSFFSFRFLYYRLPIERAFALLLMRRRSTIDWAVTLSKAHLHLSWQGCKRHCAEWTITQPSKCWNGSTEWEPEEWWNLQTSWLSLSATEWSWRLTATNWKLAPHCHKRSWHLTAKETKNLLSQTKLAPYCRMHWIKSEADILLSRKQHLTATSES
jgi:hypothetical protein